MKMKTTRKQAMRALGAIALAGTTLLTGDWRAAPAQTASLATASMNGGTLGVVGTADRELLTLSQFEQGGTVTIVNTGPGATVKAGAGCTQDAVNRVRCGGVFFVNVFAQDGNDSITFDGASPTIIAGGRGNDTIFGGSGRDELRGGDDSDTLNGRGDVDKVDGGSGFDKCTGETKSRCEQ